MDSKELFEQGIEQAGRPYVIFKNISIILMVLLGYIGMYPLKIYGIHLISIVYLVFIAAMLMFVLRRHLCTQCYYYGKLCHCGWGKLASGIFEKESGSQKLGGRLALITWSILMLLPLIGIPAAVILKKASWQQELIFFVPFVILLIINGYLHKKDCTECKMRFICPGSAAK